MSDESSLAGFIPVDPESVGALEDAAGRLAAAERQIRGAVETLVELSEDLKIDAVRRLRERGASEAQVDRYEGAYRAQAALVRDALDALDAARVDAERAIARVRG